MLTIFLRTILIYLILAIAMRVMGKRQIGQLEVSELITTLMLSELATGPIENRDIPLSFAAIPIITLLTLEVVNSTLLIKIPRIKNLLSAKPSLLIERGILNQSELTHIRMSIDELVGELRQLGIATIEEVDYAILEQNGKLTVIPRADDQPPTRRELGIATPPHGIAHILIADGFINQFNLRGTGHDEKWLNAQLKQQNLTTKQVFLMTLDDNGQIYLIPKEPKHK